MNKVIILQGLPASGKSTYAMELAKKTNWKRLNKDLFREMLDGLEYNPQNEKEILEIRDLLLRRFLSREYNVVVDDTNFKQTHITNISKIAKEYGAEVEVKFIDTPLYECLERDKVREHTVGRKVIMDMYNRYVKSKNDIPAMCSFDITPWIIVDIDGTLAYSVGRSPYDLKKVKNDIPNAHLAYLLDFLVEHFNVAIVSGREDSCRGETIEWLSRERILYDKLIMRKAGDNRADEIVKKEIFVENFSKENVFCVFDDRPKVVRMWKELGLMVFDCNIMDSRIDF